jgi:hypothetical protein
MGAPSVADIIKSGAMIYIAPAGEALPDETTVAAGASWGGTWVRVGYTKEPLTVEYEPEEHEVEVEEHLAPVDRWKTKETLRMETVLAESEGISGSHRRGQSVAQKVGGGHRGHPLQRPPRSPTPTHLRLSRHGQVQRGTRVLQEVR